jgi:hypothetical protein
LLVCLWNPNHAGPSGQCTPFPPQSRSSHEGIAELLDNHFTDACVELTRLCTRPHRFQHGILSLKLSSKPSSFSQLSLAVLPWKNEEKSCWNADGVRGRKLELQQLLVEYDFHICVQNLTRHESVRALRFAVYHRTDLPTLGGGTAILILWGSPGCAAPGGYCRTLSVGDQTGEVPVGLRLTHAALDRVT